MLLPIALVLLMAPAPVEIKPVVRLPMDTIAATSELAYEFYSLFDEELQEPKTRDRFRRYIAMMLRDGALVRLPAGTACRVMRVEMGIRPPRARVVIVDGHRRGTTLWVYKSTLP